MAELQSVGRVVVVAGQQPYNDGLNESLGGFARTYGVPIIADSIANQGSNSFTLNKHDVFLAGLDEVQKNDLRPDLLITFGQSLISKSLKLFLRNASPKQHWHVQATGEAADTFRGLTSLIRMEPKDFFSRFSQETPTADAESLAPWQLVETKATALLEHFFAADNQPFNEFSAFRPILTALATGTALHLANSMAVRYANILGIPRGQHIEVFANRGTSGIDGCTSTAVGAALAQPERPVALLTGDVAFFFDRNAFWHNYPPPNLRVVLFNNHGGGIFRMIDGPRQQPELEEFFETRQTLTAENTAKDFNLRYFPV